MYLSIVFKLINLIKLLIYSTYPTPRSHYPTYPLGHLTYPSYPTSPPTLSYQSLGNLTYPTYPTYLACPRVPRYVG